MDFVIECIPRPWPKENTNRETGFVYHRDPKGYWREYKKVIVATVKAQIIQNGYKMIERYVPVSMGCHFFLPRPKSVSVKERRHPCVKPDLDNYEYAIANLLQGLCYVDDCQIVSRPFAPTKNYADYNIIKWPRFEEGIVNEWWTEMSSYDSPVDNYLKQCRQPFTGVFIRVEEVT